MASVFIWSRSGKSTFIDYSLLDGRVRRFVYQGKKLFDEDSGIAIDGWRSQLVDCVIENELHEDDGNGLPAFVYPLIEEGLIKTTI